MYKERKTTRYKDNSFGLIYKNAIQENKKHKVNIHPISYELNGIMIAANIYTPKDYLENGQYQAIVIAHPNGETKEYTSGLYAQKLAEMGYVTITADALFHGESGGTPRNQDIPYFRIEDIRGMVDIISLYSGVDISHIYALGIGEGGGYTLSASQSDKRIQKVAVISMINSGSLRREGIQNIDSDTVIERLIDVSKIREKEIQTNESIRSDEKFVQRNLMDLMIYDPVQFMYLIQQPLLMIIKENDDINYMSEDAYNLAIHTLYKELYEMKNKDYIVDKIVKKLNLFYKGEEK
jgi:Hydrolases of the alpha/beta superfamily